MKAADHQHGKPNPKRKRKRTAAYGIVGALVCIVMAAASLCALILRAETLTAAPTPGRAHDGAPPPGVIPFRIPVGPPEAVLDVWVYEPAAGTPRTAVPTVLVLHGYSDSKATMQALGPRFAKRGSRVVLVDLRGHGSSTGERISYGVFEARDLVQVLDALEGKGLVRAPVAVYGPSYGGLVAIQLAGLDRRVERVVVAGTMTSLLAHERPRLRELLGAAGRYLPDAALDLVTIASTALVGFDARMASAATAAGRSRARIIFVHGSDDQLVPIERVAGLVEECGERCELMVLERMSHHESLSNQPLRDRMNEFFSDESERPRDALSRGELETLRQTGLD